MGRSAVSIRRICIITGSRGEYGYIRPVIHELSKCRDVEYYVVATNMLVLPEFGLAVNSFIDDGIEVKYRIDMAVSGYSNSSMTKSIGIFIQSLADIFSNDLPDIVLLAGDRGEQLAAAIAGAHFNILTAHIQAGELSGNIDGMTRHAITKFVHLHFASNEDAAIRLKKMGEQDFRIYNVGAPQLDDFASYSYMERSNFYNLFRLDNSRPFCILLQHSITEESDLGGHQMLQTLKALEKREEQVIIVHPNNDAGSLGVSKVLSEFKNKSFHVVKNVNRELFANFLFFAEYIIGNSSSGILEAPSFKRPAVNIGRRQIGRLQGINVINVEDFDVEKIIAAIDIAKSKSFKESLVEMKNPYGDGKSSKRIVEVLRNVPFTQQYYLKELTY
jgi:GDP/UDP-N,N'-diacetylbacillosamine 2-epimerase (hydrolysing)